MMIFFGHQSVGQDLLTGLTELAEFEPSRRSATQVVGLREYQAARAAQQDGASAALTIVHAALGRNREPLTKLAEFATTLQSWGSPLPDIAMLKFCYVDIENSRDAEQLLACYETASAELRERFPTIRFAHCTVPLRRLPSGIYARVRRSLGHRHPQVSANRARETFNDGLRQRYGASGSLFDLARLEATEPNGRPCTVRERGVVVPSLASQWTYDGGHLNQPGRTMAAAAFLQFFHASGVSR